MLRIQRSSDGAVVFSLSGRIEAPDILELERLLNLEAAGQRTALDLLEITLVDRDAVPFLARCQADGIQLVNCPPFIREWIDTERSRKGPAIR
jgi:hypothetical protein